MSLLIMKRRDFIASLSASMALIAAGCRRPEQKIVPQVTPVEYLVPGVANYYTSVYIQKNFAYGILIKTREGRPIKIDGNPDSPTKGSISPKIQASLYSLYDPDRFWEPVVGNKKVDLEIAINEVAKIISGMNGRTAVIIDEHCSPALENLLNDFVNTLPYIDVIKLSYLNNLKQLNKEDNAHLYYFKRVIPNLSKAGLVVSVSSDFLGNDKASPYYASSFFRNNRIKNPRLLCIESILTATGITANERYVIKPNDYEEFLAELSREMLKKLVNLYGTETLDKRILELQSRFNMDSLHNYLQFLNERFSVSKFGFIDIIVNELFLSKERGEEVCFLGGENLSEASLAMIFQLNKMMLSIGENKIFDSSAKVTEFIDKYSDSDKFCDNLEAFDYKSIIFLDVNPVYQSDSVINSLLNKILKANKISLSLYKDETADTCGICIPLTHYLESWSDAEFFDGQRIIQQPVIAPLNKHSVSKEDFLIKLAKLINQSAFNGIDSNYAFVTKSYLQKAPDTLSWEQMLRTGNCGKNVENANSRISKDISINLNETKDLLREYENKVTNGLSLVLTQSCNLQEGKEANNAWLQELPDPVTKQTWGNAFCLSPETAKKLAIKDFDVIKVSNNSKEVELPAILIEGLSEDVIHGTLGYGRTKGGKTLKEVGKNLAQLIDISDNKSFYLINNIKVSKTGKTEKIALFQTERKITNENLLSELTKKNTRNTPKQNISIFPKYDYKGQRWAMSIDLSKCTACGSCIISCQAENNIPVVGKEEIIRGRMMNWLRIDTYEINLNDKTKYFNFPMLCQHCEMAPCESVCPVAATTHSPEGINEMTYNRCIGARFCMVNCPYKIRRFNFKNHPSGIVKPLENILNPDVTVRMQGIAEKCTFCVQRINEARYRAKDEGISKIPEEYLKTACQQACPTGAIIFGDINNPESEISKSVKRSHFKLLEELNTNPSIHYLKKL